ncbi:aminodeoxychorismate synthase component I [Chloroflexales bacterium ZM16-3]|nr:aminodeoxychorismate synthase component I [Chloroflexales bacterium ZM16-3]
MKTIIIDNYDSFTFNLYQMLAEVNGEKPLVIHNDQMTWPEVKELEYDNLIISPGAGRPEQRHSFGMCSDALLDAPTPVLGVCLGHQGIGYAYGGTVIHAPEAMHGRLSAVSHNNSILFAHIPQSFTVVRYHSLVVASKLPACLEKTAWTDDGLIMGLRHRERPLWGVQFHPESICTEYGHRLLANFRDITAQYGRPSNGRRSWAGFSVIPQRTNPQQHPSPTGMQVCSRKLAFLYSPEQVFTHVFGQKPYAFWLDSSRVEPGLSRFSFMGDASGPRSSVVQYDSARRTLAVTEGNATQHLVSQSIFDYLRQKMYAFSLQNNDLPFDLNCGFVGYFGYELQGECGSGSGHESTLFDACFLFADRLIAFDHQEGTTYLVCFVEEHSTGSAEAWFDDIEQQLKNLPPLDDLACGVHPQPITFQLTRSKRGYLDDIRQCQRYINDGETYEVCLTNQIRANISLDPLALYRSLRHVNPAPYAAFLRFGDTAILCSSPERFLHIDRDGWVESKPIKGTLPRGRTAHEDEVLPHLLQTSQKDRSENLMIVDLVRNDLGVVSEIGSVSVPKLMHVETYQTVHQLVSTIRGHLRQDISPIDCIQRAFPGGSMTGAPKIRTMEIIKELEQEARGVYAGSLGFLGLNNTVDLNIVIRTIVMTPGSLTVGVGGAVVALSDPEEEFNEMLLKAKALLHAIMYLARGDVGDSLEQIERQLRQSSGTSDMSSSWATA